MSRSESACIQHRVTKHIGVYGKRSMNHLPVRRTSDRVPSDCIGLITLSRPAGEHDTSMVDPLM
jgi:hypothetical protein